MPDAEVLTCKHDGTSHNGGVSEENGTDRRQAVADSRRHALAQWSRGSKGGCRISHVQPLILC